jgi:hypothetical protein
LPLACAIFKYAHRHHVFALHFAGDNGEIERTVFLVDQSGVDAHCCVYCCWCSASSCSIGLICSPGMTKLCLISLLHPVPSEGKHSTWRFISNIFAHFSVIWYLPERNLCLKFVFRFSRQLFFGTIFTPITFSELLSKCSQKFLQTYV